MKSTNKVNFKAQGSPLKKVKVEYEAYRPPALAEIPEEIREAFYDDGYVLKWAQVLEEHKLTGEMIPARERLYKNRHERWEYVTHTELENMGGFAGVSDLWEHGPSNIASMKDWVIVKDTALAKRPIEYHMAAQEYKVQKAFEQVKGAHNMSKLRQATHGDLPVSDDGTHITLRRPKFRQTEPSGESVNILEE